MKNRLQIILLSGILSSCSIYNYKTIDIPKETYKSPYINLDKINLAAKETKVYIYDKTNRMFLADYRYLKDSLLHLINFRKLIIENHSVQNGRPIKISQDETHVFSNREVNRQNINQTITIQTSEIDSIHNFQRRLVPENEFVLRKRARSALFDPKGFSKNTDKWKFYIQDMDDSTFECRNVGIYDSIISAKLVPKRIERKIMLNKQSLIRKNEVYLKINLSCTDKNNQIYLKPKNIMDLESYMTQKDLNLQKGDLLLKIMQTISILFAAAVLAGLIVIINAFS
jgi:hypothetical protein